MILYFEELPYPFFTNALYNLQPLSESWMRNEIVVIKADSRYLLTPKLLADTALPSFPLFGLYQ